MLFHILCGGENYDSICDLLEGKLLGKFFLPFVSGFVFKTNTMREKENIFPVDFKWNKLNKVLLLITELRNFFFHREKEKNTKSGDETKIIFHLPSVHLMEAKMLNCFWNAIQRGKRKEKFMKAKFYHTN